MLTLLGNPPNPPTPVIALITDFVIDTNEIIYIVKFELDGEGKPDFNDMGNVNFWRTNEN